MTPILIIGIIILLGFILAEFAIRLKLPRVTGYIIAGIILNPQLTKIIPADFPTHTDLVTNISLSFITFSVGGTLLYSKIKELGKSILCITFFEAEFAFFAALAGLLVSMPFMKGTLADLGMGSYIAFSILLSCLASPTDPSATLAVVHQYKAHGKVTSTIMGVAAIDDVMGIMNYSIAIAVSLVLIDHNGFSLNTAVISPLISIGGGIILGIIFGFIFNAITAFIAKESEGVLIVVIFGFLSICFGVSTFLHADELLATMAMGVVVVNFNIRKVKIFRMLERYTEEIIFVLFFTISGMHLDLHLLAGNIVLIVVFVILRTAGKFTGVYTGAAISHAPPKVRKYTFGGLIPQGGIVVGLALIMKQNPSFSAFADVIINIVIGATVIHELIGPVFSEYSLRRAGEIHLNKAKS